MSFAGVPFRIPHNWRLRYLPAGLFKSSGGTRMQQRRAIPTWTGCEQPRNHGLPWHRVAQDGDLVAGACPGELPSRTPTKGLAYDNIMTASSVPAERRYSSPGIGRLPHQEGIGARCSRDTGDVPSTYLRLSVLLSSASRTVGCTLTIGAAHVREQLALHASVSVGPAPPRRSKRVSACATTWSML